MEKQMIFKILSVWVIGLLSVSMDCHHPKPPTASFSYSVTGREVQFIDKSIDPDGEIIGWDWKFGDGSGSAVQNPSHRYADTGTYEVFLTVTDNDGKTGNCSDSVNIVNRIPIASFSYAVDGRVVEFTDQSTDEDGEIVAWDWKFGDGLVSNIQNPIHRYTVAGTYEVVLTVADDIGAKDTCTQNVTLYFDFAVYNDSGIPEDGVIWCWSAADYGGPPATFDASYTGETAPEGTKCFKTTSGVDWTSPNYAGWGVFLARLYDRTVNLSAYSSLNFWVKTPENLKVEVQQDNRYGRKSTVFLADHGWNGTNTWQEIAVPANAFSGVNVHKIFGPFMITVEKGDRTFYVDFVRWVD